jgi:hypothetical protein
MDDEQIRQIAAGVLADLRGPGTPALPSSGSESLERRVSALEGAVRQLQGRGPTVTVAAAAVSHPSQALLPVPAGGDRCLLEPERPCVESGMCRAFGH